MLGKNILFKYCLPLILMCDCFLYCSTQVAGPGNSSDVGNPVVVASVHGTVGGSGPAGCRLTMLNAEYNPAAGGLTNDIVMNDTTDTLGKFCFDNLPEGHYNFIFNDSTGKALYIGHVPVFADSVWTTRFDSLSGTGYIEGNALAADSKLLTWTFVYIPGTPYCSYTGSSGTFRMEKIPAGSYTLMYYGVQEDFSKPKTFTGPNNSALISAGDTASVNTGTK